MKSRPSAPLIPPWLDLLALGFVPGVLAGTQIAGLIFFLNPELPFGPSSVSRGIFLYGALIGVASLLVTVPILWRRRHRARRALPWAITGALAFSAVLSWVNASQYAFFLPPGINVRLIKAAALLSLSALIAFYTALIHSWKNRPYGIRSRLGYVVLALASVYFIVERREAFRPSPPPTPRPSVVADTLRPRLLVVGLDGATLDAVLPSAGQGKLPFFEQALRDGAYGRLTSLTPNQRLPLWSTLATGKYPYRHGLVSPWLYEAPQIAAGAHIGILPSALGFRHWGTLGQPRRAADGRDRQVLALWEILPRLGISSAVIAWPASAPVSEDAQLVLSDRFFTHPREEEATTRPPELAERGRIFRLREDEIDPVLAARFGPVAQERVLSSLASDIWRESLGAFVLDDEPAPQAMILTLDGLAEVSELFFGGYAAARLEGLQDPAYEEAALQLENYYSYTDEVIAKLWEKIPSPKILAVISAYGSGSPSGWGRAWRELGREPLVAGSFNGSPDGVLLLYGEGIRGGSLLTGADLVDVVPTLIYALGLPVARDLDGQVLTDAFDRSSFLARNPLTFVPSYQTLVAPSGSLPR
ncbi:MAG: alkaline phosphatase family protein [Acidobacteriota bacterium]